MKKCYVCNNILLLGDFHRNASKPDGLKECCKSCSNALDRAYRLRNQNYLLGRNAERHRKRRRLGLESDRAKAREHAMATRVRYPDRARARREVRWAIDAGRLIRSSCCERCGTIDPKRADGRSAIHAHHHNGYALPLDVVWLCQKCHAEEHRARGKK